MPLSSWYYEQGYITIILQNTSVQLHKEICDETRSKVIDCDVHNALKSHLDLVPYLEEPWKTRVAENGLGLMFSGYYSPIGVGRKDAVPPGGGQVGSDSDFVIEQLIDSYNVDYAILTHGWEFDLKTGKSLVKEKVRLRCYKVFVEDGEIGVEL